MKCRVIWLLYDDVMFLGETSTSKATPVPFSAPPFGGPGMRPPGPGYGMPPGPYMGAPPSMNMPPMPPMSKCWCDIVHNVHDILSLCSF